ncbi:MAG: 4Fe-4S binding protein [Deltaproteobacteria bacterium]|nr:4Fe-4S binding protein [Deltaproteobacteria bacterium]
MQEPKSASKLEYVRGGAIHACATSTLMKTGSWRVFKPVVETEKCEQCKLCYWYCPDACIQMTEEAIKIDYEYCKGCGICAAECPTHAIVMEREED